MRRTRSWRASAGLSDIMPRISHPVWTLWYSIPYVHCEYVSMHNSALVLFPRRVKLMLPSLGAKSALPAGLGVRYLRYIHGCTHYCWKVAPERCCFLVHPSMPDQSLIRPRPTSPAPWNPIKLQTGDSRPTRSQLRYPRFVPTSQEPVKGKRRLEQGEDELVESRVPGKGMSLA